MESIILGKDKKLPDVKHLTLCLGNFDGVHLGHQHLLFKAIEDSEGPVGVLLFSDNPAKYYDSKKSVSILTSLEDKIRILNGYNIDYAYIINIDKSFFKLSPEEFISQVLKPINPSLIVVGEDYSFGELGKGDPTLLKSFFKVEVVDLVLKDGKKVSTQNIIEDIQTGQIKKANCLLGRSFEIKGKVIHGEANGRKIGFPTANISLETNYVMPKTGVYAGIVYSRGRSFSSIINVGTNPTIGLLKHPRIECYIKGLHDDIYGETLYVNFIDFIREEKTFASLDELKVQLEKDVKVLN
jgi:riboflavin kinase/FMN adenylyltransferase